MVYKVDRKIEKKKYTVKNIAYAALGFAFILFVLFFVIFADHSSKLNVNKDKISIVEIREGSFQEYISIMGTVTPIQTFYLDVTEGGRVVTKYVQEGAFLKAGDPIIKLDNAQLTLDVIYNEANVFQQINNLRSTRLSFEQSKLNIQGELLNINYEILNSKKIYENNKVLFQKNYISDLEFQQSKDKYEYLIKKRNLTLEAFKQDSLYRMQQIDQLEQSVQQLQNNLLLTKGQLENLTVKAPINGQLTSLKVEIGQSIGRGENLGQIDNIDSFKVQAEVDEHYITSVKPGQYAEFSMDGTAYKLTVKTVYPEVKNGRFIIDMMFNGKRPAEIRRGQSLQVKLELGGYYRALLLPRGGFYQVTGGQWIFVVDKNGTEATKRNIKLGRQNPSSYEVLEGLNAGEKVVVSSYDNYKDIEKLIIK